MLHAPSAGRNLNRWLGGYARHAIQHWALPRPSGPRHVMFALCDHFEPLWAHASEERARARVERWLRSYPTLTQEFRDADGRPPRHSFFFPAEQYRPHFLDALAQLTGMGLAEVELHLHHDRDTPEGLRKTIVAALELYGHHGHVPHDASGRPRYGFIHGNWCLANSRSDGRWCGVDSELEVLFDTGCYADFTFPSAPDATQPSIVDEIYWPTGDLGKARAHERGESARVGHVMRDRLLMIQGPLALSRGGRFGVRIENAALTAHDPATPRRIQTWVSQAIHVSGRPEWIFVKAHTHGAPETQAESLLGDGGRALHRELRRRYDDGKNFVLHYVTAREMFNIAFAAMLGATGDPNAFRDHVLPPPQAAT